MGENEKETKICGCYLDRFGCECKGCCCVPQSAHSTEISPPTRSGLSMLDLANKVSKVGFDGLTKDEQADYSLGIYGLLFACSYIEKEGKLK